ncbi:MAG: M48 family metalloprotease [Candidatus Micrarchaeota archaeon]|nr:M48 family metalloprotease [Candidatus Micrarchaeota archaeon]
MAVAATISTVAKELKACGRTWQAPDPVMVTEMKRLVRERWSTPTLWTRQFKSEVKLYIEPSCESQGIAFPNFELREHSKGPSGYANMENGINYASLKYSFIAVADRWAIKAVVAHELWHMIKGLGVGSSIEQRRQSRQTEFEADAFAAKIVSPMNLAVALAMINQYSNKVNLDYFCDEVLQNGGRARLSNRIFTYKRSISHLRDTHPDMAERIARLLNMEAQNPIWKFL